MSVSRDELDKLVDRVDRIERTPGATIEIMAAEVVGLRTYLDGRFAALEENLGGRLDGVEQRLDTYTEQVNVAITQGSDAAARYERFSRAIGDHFGIELGDS